MLASLRRYLRMGYATSVENVAMDTTTVPMENLLILVTFVVSGDMSLPNAHQAYKVIITYFEVISYMSHCIGYSPKHSSPFLVHPPTLPQVMLQSHVPHTTNKHPVNHFAGVHGYGRNNIKTAVTKQPTPINTTNARPVTVESPWQHGSGRFHSDAAAAAPQRSQFSSRPPRDVHVMMNSIEPQSPRRTSNHRGGSKRGRASQKKSDVYHNGNKQRRQQDN